MTSLVSPTDPITYPTADEVASSVSYAPAAGADMATVEAAERAAAALDAARLTRVSNRAAWDAINALPRGEHGMYTEDTRLARQAANAIGAAADRTVGLISNEIAGLFLVDDARQVLHVHDTSGGRTTVDYAALVVATDAAGQPIVEGGEEDVDLYKVTGVFATVGEALEFARG